MKVEPMLCLLRPTLPEGDEWEYEIKWDGFRALGEIAAGKSRFLSRNLKPLTSLAPDAAAELPELPCRSATLDGEIVAFVDGKPSFQALQGAKSRRPDIRFVAFDLLELDGKDLRKQPLEKRRLQLGKLLRDQHDHILFSRSLSADPETLMEQAQETGLEGIIAKRRTSRYEDGERTGAWTKWKAERTGTFVAAGIIPNGRDFEELIVGERDKQGLRMCARVRAGFVAKTRREVMEKLAPLKSTDCPFYNLPEPKGSRWGGGLTADEMGKCRWFKPRTKVELAFLEWTDSRSLRHPRFLK